MKEIKRQVWTERGFLYVDAEYESAKEAMDNGYSYAFHSSQIGDLYSMCLDDKGLRHSFVIVKER